MPDMMQIPVPEEFKQQYASLFYELSKEAFEAAKNDAGLKRYMTKKEAAAWIGISFTHFQKLEELGLPTIDAGGKVLVDREDITKFMNKHKRNLKQLNY
ncbi:hypothetical protein ACTWQB_09455 [Piscibacillus sp. B03]|uniref:hypothetical protein n=1 Tax=Piscibacillus sp. B03 TaxID=3457430 RepID=UPI003FCDBF03